MIAIADENGGIVPLTGSEGTAWCLPMLWQMACDGVRNRASVSSVVGPESITAFERMTAATIPRWISPMSVRRLDGYARALAEEKPEPAMPRWLAGEIKLQSMDWAGRYSMDRTSSDVGRSMAAHFFPVEQLPPPLHVRCRHRAVTADVHCVFHGASTGQDPRASSTTIVWSPVRADC